MDRYAFLRLSAATLRQFIHELLVMLSPLAAIQLVVSFPVTNCVTGLLAPTPD